MLGVPACLLSASTWEGMKAQLGEVSSALGRGWRGGMRQKELIKHQRAVPNLQRKQSWRGWCEVSAGRGAGGDVGQARG